MKDLNEILELIESIPENMCSSPQPRFLYDLSSRTKGTGSVVEIGTCAGKSTIALAFGQLKKNSSKITTIDIQEHPNIKRNILNAECADSINRIIGRSSIVAKTWKEPIELLWIDGDHRSNGIISDIRLWSKFVIPGGIMAFHDYLHQNEPGFKEVWKAIYKQVFSRPERWRIISDREAGSIIAFQRLPDYVENFTFSRRIKESFDWKLRNIKWYFEEILERISNVRSRN
jgi:hypothetical protein